MKKLDNNAVRRMFAQRGYEVVSIYRDSRNCLYVNYICSKHREAGIKKIRCSAFVQGQGCKSCGTEKMSQKIKLTHDDFLSRIDDEIQKEYKILGKYTKANNKILVKHTKCNKEYAVRAMNLMNGQKCPFCTGRYRTTDEFKEMVYSLVRDEYDVLGEYINTTTKIKMIHNVCGNKYLVNPKKFLCGNRCPECMGSYSKMTHKIKCFLCMYHISYKREYRFADCRDKGMLPFDFAVFDSSGLFCLIEADGEQHFVEQKSGKFVNTLKKIVKHDNIKTIYCKTKNIPLIRIPYYKTREIEGILLDKLKTLIGDRKPDMEYILPLEDTVAFDAAKVLEIRKIYAKGELSIHSIASQYGLTSYRIKGILMYDVLPAIGLELKDRIYNIVKKHHGGSRKKDKILNISEKDQRNIFDLYSSGKFSMRKIALNYGTNHKMISKIVRVLSMTNTKSIRSKDNG
jgi:hypothetical protein